MHRVWKDTRAREIESVAHTLLADCHIKGEWFGCTIDEAEAAIREAHFMVYTGLPLPLPWWRRVWGWMKWT